LTNILLVITDPKDWNTLSLPLTPTHSFWCRHCGNSNFRDLETKKEENNKKQKHPQAELSSGVHLLGYIFGLTPF
jgi:hypothetical protein